jgi:hypothetical protein
MIPTLSTTILHSKGSIIGQKSDFVDKVEKVSHLIENIVAPNIPDIVGGLKQIRRNDPYRPFQCHLSKIILFCALR